MNETVFSILLFVLGLIVGLVSIIVINILKKKNQEKEADSIIEKAKNNTSRTDVTFSIKASKPRFLVWPLKTAPPDKAFKASCCFCGCIIVAIMISTETMINSVIIKLYNALPPIYSTITLLFYHR